MSAGTATGCVVGQAPPVEYARWLLWSALSSEWPSQQFGKLTMRKRPVRELQVGTVLEIERPPHVQKVTLVACGAFAFESPAMSLSPAGNGCTVACVRRT